MANTQKSATELRRDLSDALEEVLTGKTVEITKHGKTVALLVPAPAKPAEAAPVVAEPATAASPAPVAAPAEAPAAPVVEDSPAAMA
jgi:prevent-host-death family protein